MSMRMAAPPHAGGASRPTRIRYFCRMPSSASERGQFRVDVRPHDPSWEVVDLVVVAAEQWALATGWKP